MMTVPAMANRNIGTEDLEGSRRNVLCSRTNMKRILVSVWCLAVWLPVPASGAAQQPAAPRPKVLAFFTAGGELSAQEGELVQD